MHSTEELASLNELRVEKDLDFSQEETSPEDVSLLDTGMDFYDPPASFQEQEIDSEQDVSDLVEDPEDLLSDYALSFKDTASSEFVPRSEEPLINHASSPEDDAPSYFVPAVEESIDNAASNEINVSPGATISGNEGEEIPSSSQVISAALPSLEGESLTDPNFVAAIPSTFSSRISRRIAKSKRFMDDQFVYYK